MVSRTISCFRIEKLGNTRNLYVDVRLTVTRILPLPMMAAESRFMEARFGKVVAEFVALAVSR